MADQAACDSGLRPSRPIFGQYLMSALYGAIRFLWISYAPSGKCTLFLGDKRSSVDENQTLATPWLAKY